MEKNHTYEDLCSNNFAKKAIVFQIIDLYGNFSNVCAVFALPNSNMFSFIMDKVREIDQKWSVHEKFCIIGSVTDGEFEPATVENFLNNNNERKQWTHCEGYIHILKRLRNPLIDSSHAISMMGLIYLTSKYDNLNRKLRRSDLIVKDEMNVESCLNLIKEDVLQALQTIRSNLKEEFHDILPSVPNFFNNFVLSDSKNIHKSGITDFIMKDIDIANLNKMTEKQLNEYFKKITIFRHSPSKKNMLLLILCIIIYGILENSITPTKLDIISDQTLRGIVSIYRMLKRLWFHSWILPEFPSNDSIISHNENQSNNCFPFDNYENWSSQQNSTQDQTVDKNNNDDDVSDVGSDLSYDSVDSNITTISDELRAIEAGQKFFKLSDRPVEDQKKILTSAISSNGLELIFSLIQHKCNNFCIYDLCSILLKSHRIVVIEHLTDTQRLFSLPKKSCSKHYNRLNIKYNGLPRMPDNKLPTQETINREKVTQKIQSLNHREKSVSLRSNSSVVIRTSVDLIVETTDFKVRSLTDFYADNLSNNSTIEFPQFIRPRRKIEKSVVELTNISNEMVLNGVREDQAISRLVAELPKKAIIIAHNSPFDKDAIFKAYMYWRQKKLLQYNFKENRLIFEDSLGIIKQKLLEKLENYKLGTIFKTLFDRDIVDQHRAKSDVIALKQILQHPRILGNDVINSVKRYLSEITIKATLLKILLFGSHLCHSWKVQH
ncbi:hypothetical protein FDP41_012430 [Naegleria fowleri]|uniref:Exonuclease domain-containing protein n=1 Tax=Naegleria fowleri TaxID=5763 RepID=A0A6A5BUM6_NAEFO|nr:uncharacterized protein FDP41_012430 [Naegleria fowleri]KAF0981773.1 hypothetical protein FDP41_012430 [Naegleria fowleri]